MTSTSKPPLLADTLSASAALGVRLAQVTGFAAGLVTIGLLVGWRELSSYYATLGAPWVIETLPPSRFVHAAAGLLGAITVAALVSIYLLSQRQANARGLRRWSIAAGLVACVLLAASTLPQEHVSLSTSHLLSSLSSTVFALSVGLAVGELVALLADQGLKWNSYMVSVVQFVVLFGIFLAPSQVGTSRAKMHLDPASSTLPTIAAAQLPGTRQWRLVAVLDGTALLITLPASNQKPAFRYVAPTEISEIQR